MTDEVRKPDALRRIWESATATVVSGLILWSLTSGKSQPEPPAERIVVATVPATQPPVGTAGSPILVASPNEAAPPAPQTPLVAPPAPQTAAVAPIVRPATVPAVLPLAAKQSPPPYSVPLGSVLLFQNFSGYKDGDPSRWGQNTIVKTGLDHRNWLVANAEGVYPVGYRLRLPNEFYFECRYSAYMPEVTRGILGWWKDPVVSKITFVDEQGVKYVIDWVVKFGNDTTRLNPLGSSTLYAKKYYHTIKLPDGTTNEIGIAQPDGRLRIDRDNNVLKVFLDGQPAGIATMSRIGQLVGFELDVVKAKTGALCFTDVQIAR
ncbi:MAG: hypothetical protein LLG00_06155 [Planctomycetaceae bacterium]|nr:hypothetical protein [Planctomycetaceae bacterium]